MNRGRGAWQNLSSSPASPRQGVRSRLAPPTSGHTRLFLRKVPRPAALRLPCQDTSVCGGPDCCTRAPR
eukprot:11158322-Lingulodinium_polyedra.AAC.1